MKVHSMLANQHQNYSSLTYLGNSINNVPKFIKEAISKAINSANLEGKEKVIIPRAFVKGAEISARIFYNKSISDLNIKEWKYLVENTLMNVDPKDIKTKSFLNYLLSYLR